MTAIRYCLIFFIVFISFVFGIFSFFIQHEQIDFSALHNYNAGRPTLLLDDEGNEWTRFALDRREPIDFMHVPLHVKNAFVAAEDHFFGHTGVFLYEEFFAL